MRGGIVLHAQPGSDPPPKNEIAAPMVGEPGRGEFVDDKAEALRETSKGEHRRLAVALQGPLAGRIDRPGTSLPPEAEPDWFQAIMTARSRAS
jgi:hypothetical protein